MLTPETPSSTARRYATDPAVVARQAAAVAAAWSPPGAPTSWRLTAAQFAALRDDPELLAIAADIAPDRLPALLFSAAATSLVLELAPRPLRDWFPRVGEPQPPLEPGFQRHYRAFCLDHRHQLAELCARHRYQMNEVGRCANLLPALTPAIEEDREIVLIDIGTAAGLALHLDRYRYRFHGPGDRVVTVGDEDRQVLLDTQVRGSRIAPIPRALPRIAERIGIDVEPLDLRDAAVRGWLSACVPQEIGAITRFHHAVELAIANPTRTIRGSPLDVLPAVLSRVPPGPLVCLIDTYVHVFFTIEDLSRFRALLDELGARRDLDWISIDPLIPLGDTADRTVLDVPAPPTLTRRNRDEGVFGVIGRIRYRAGRRSPALLGIAHPGAAWIEWLDD